MNTIHNEIIVGRTGCRFVSNDSGQPAKRVIATPFIGIRSRGCNTERGLGVEYFSGMVGDNEGVHHIFLSMETKNPKEYLRAFQILNCLGRMDPDILAACAQAGKKHAGLDDDSFRMLKKYQPAQVSIILEKRRAVFEQPCDEKALQHIITGFLWYGFQINNPLTKTKTSGKEKHEWNVLPSMTGTEMSLAI